MPWDIIGQSLKETIRPLPRTAMFRSKKDCLSKAALGGCSQRKACTDCFAWIEGASRAGAVPRANERIARRRRHRVSGYTPHADKCVARPSRRCAPTNVLRAGAVPRANERAAHPRRRRVPMNAPRARDSAACRWMRPPHVRQVYLLEPALKPGPAHTPRRGTAREE